MTKAEHPTGEWTNEPDDFEFEHVGLLCRGHRSRLGAWAGYVRVSPGHPLFGVDYDDEAKCLNDARDSMMEKPLPDQPSMGLLLGVLSGNVKVSPGAILDVHGGITWANRASGGSTATEGEWWFGFDCSHLYDLQPYIKREFHEGVYRNQAYVEAQCRQLAEELAALQTKGTDECQS